jgi:uncharacterized membrane protein YeaQ/YmgE (transglycosylase-associated protein family)
MVVTMDIVWFIVVGLLTALWAAMILSPESRRYGNAGLFLFAIAGALIGGLLFPGLGWFLIPITLIGTLALSFLGAVLFLWILGLLFALLMPVK